MALRVTKASDIEVKKFKILAYGNSGAGKTWMCSQAKNVAVLLLEENGLQSISNANPDAIVYQGSTMEDIQEFFKLAISGDLAKDGIETIMIDGLTEVQQLMKDSILQKKRQGAEFTIKDWGVLSERMRRFMRTVRNLPFNVICTSLAESIEEEGKPRRIRPAFQGKKLYNEVSQYFNAVAYIYKIPMGKDENGARKFAHTALFDGPSDIICKPCAPLSGSTEGPSQEWLDILAGNTQQKD